MKRSKPPAKLLEKIFRLFPSLHLILIALALFITIKNPTLNHCFFVIFIIYFFPLIAWHLLFLNIIEKKQSLGPSNPKGSAWLISYYIQYNFTAFPLFERILIVLPGFYSMWLRLWGSKIGKKVIWTPNMIIYDRSLVIVNDYSLIGDFTSIGSHLINRKKDKLILFVKKIKIGRHVVIGARSSLGPGSDIPDAASLPANSRALLGRIERSHVGKTTRS